MKAKDLNDEFIRKVKLCCEVLKLDYESFLNMPLAQQIGYIKAIVDIKAYENPIQDKAKIELLKVLEEKENRKLDEDIDELLEMVNKQNDGR